MTQAAKTKPAAGATKKAGTAKKQTSSKGSTGDDESADNDMPKKQTVKKGKRGKVVLDSSSDESDSETVSKKPAAAKGKSVKVKQRNTLTQKQVTCNKCVELLREISQLVRFLINFVFPRMFSKDSLTLYPTV